MCDKSRKEQVIAKLREIEFLYDESIREDDKCAYHIKDAVKKYSRMLDAKWFIRLSR